jgi:hypothetical protein
MSLPLRKVSLGALGALFACADGGPAAPEGLRRVLVGHRLEQQVVLTPAAPRAGDALSVRSLVRNRGPGSVQFEARVCGLDWRTDLQLTPPHLFRCGAYSQSGSLAPGDTLIQGEALGTVTSSPGSYTLEVRHLLDPNVWVRIPVAVRE